MAGPWELFQSQEDGPWKLFQTQGIPKDAELSAAMARSEEERANRASVAQRAGLRAPSMNVRLNDGTVIRAPIGDDARRDFVASAQQARREQLDRQAERQRQVAESIDSPRRMADPAFQLMSKLYGGFGTMAREGGELSDALIGLKGGKTAAGAWGVLGRTLLGPSLAGQLAGIGADERLREGNLANAERGGGTRLFRTIGDTIAVPFDALSGALEDATTAAAKFERGQNQWGVRTDANGHPIGSAWNPANWTLGDSPTFLGQVNQFAGAVGSSLPALSSAVLKSPALSVAVGGSMGATSNAEQAEQEIDAAWQSGALQGTDAFRRLVAQGHKPEDVYRALRESAGQGAAISSFIPAGVGGLITQKVFGPIEGAALRTGANRALTTAGRVGIGALGDPAEEGFEQFAANVGADRASGMQQDPERGVAENIIGALPFGVMGAGRAAHHAAGGNVAEAFQVLGDPNLPAQQRAEAALYLALDGHQVNPDDVRVTPTAAPKSAPAITPPNAPNAAPRRELGAPAPNDVDDRRARAEAGLSNAASILSLPPTLGDPVSGAAQAIVPPSTPNAAPRANVVIQSDAVTPAPQASADEFGMVPPNLTPREPAPEPVQPGDTRESLIDAWRAAVTPEEKARAAGRIAAFDAAQQPASELGGGPAPVLDTAVLDAALGGIAPPVAPPSASPVIDFAALAQAIGLPSESAASPGAPPPSVPEAEPQNLSAPNDTIMQNRDRKRAASIAQMQDIRRNPDPDRLGFSRDPSTGAPMVGEGVQIPDADKGRADAVKEPDGTKTPVRYAVVEADRLAASHDADGNTNPDYATAPLKALSNGRTAGLQAAYGSGHADAYRAGIMADAELHGVPREAIASKRKPVLVRLYDPSLNTGDMGARSNASQQLGLSPVEQAQTDARALPDLSGLKWNEDGSISPARNANFFRAWFRKLGATQAANLQDRNGHANAMALQRVRAALVQRAYDDERLLSALIEDVDSDNRNVVNALARAAPGFAKLDDTPYAKGVKAALTGGMQILRDAKARGLSIEDALAQQDMFGRNPDADSVAQYMAGNAKSAKRMAEAFAAVAEYAARAEQQAATLDVFGNSPQHTTTDALRSAGILENEYGTSTGDDARSVREGNGSREQAGRGRTATGDAGGFQLASQPATDARADTQRVDQSGLFAPPTAQEHTRATRDAKDAERNGLGRDVVRPEQGDGDLLAGDRPAQARVDEASESRQRGEDEADFLELSDADLTPAQRASFDRQSIDRKALRAKLSREQGAADADAMGLREAVQAALGKSGVDVVYLRGMDGLPPDMLAYVERKAKERGSAMRTAGLFNPVTKEVLVFTDVARTPQMAAFTASHEIAGHLGLRALLGDLLDAVLDLAVQNPTVKAVADHMYTSRKMYKDVQSGKKTERQQRLLSVEEALADLAAANRTGNWQRIQDKHGVKVPPSMRSRVAAMLQNVLRRIKALFGKQGVAFTDAQVLNLLENAWQAAQGDSAIGPPSSALESTEDRIDLTPTFGTRDAKFGDTTITYGVSRDGQTVEVVLVRTPKAKRGGGSARRAMESLLAEADANGQRVVLTVEPMDSATSKTKLQDFYRSLGFKPNSGRARDFTTRATMIREPQAPLESTEGQTQSEALESVEDDAEPFGLTPPTPKLTPVERAFGRRGALFGKLAADGMTLGAVTQAPNGRLQSARVWGDGVRRRLQDKLIDVLRLQETVSESGKGVTGIGLDDAMNAYALETLSHGSIQNAMNALEQKHVTPIKEAIRKSPFSLEQFTDYLFAKAAPERNTAIAKINRAMPDAGSGITTQAAKDVLAGKEAGPYSGKVLTPEAIALFRTLEPHIRAMREMALNNAVVAGQITQQMADALRSKYPNYVPMRGKDGELDERRGTGKGLSQSSAGIKRALGRGEDNLPQDIFGELVGDAQRSILAKGKSASAKALLRFALTHPMPDVYEVQPVDMEWRFSEVTGEAYLAVKNAATDKTSMVIYHDGKPIRLRINDTQLAAAVLNMGADDLRKLVKVLGALNRWRSATLTRYNPGFMPVNMLRDLHFGLAAIAAEQGAGAAARALKLYPSAMRAAYRHEREQRGDASVPDAQKSMDDWAAEAYSMGISTGITLSDAPKDLQRRAAEGAAGIMELAASGKKWAAVREGVMRSGKPILDLIEAGNGATEMALRLATYVEQRQRGVSKLKAAEYAKNVTINFNRKGTWGPFLNALYLFYNASIQGTHAVLRVMRNPKVVAYLSALGAAQAFLAMGMMGSDDDKDGITEWDKIPDWVKRTSFIIPMGTDHYVAIPMPYGFNIFPYLGGRVAQRVQLGDRPTDSNIATDLLSATTEAFSPVPVNEGYRSLFGDQVGFMMGLAANRDDLGRPIAKETPYQDYASPRALEGKTTTPRAYQVTAQLLAKLGGGDLAEKIPPVGYLDVAPEQLEAITNYMGGGIMSLLNKGVSWQEQLAAGNLDSTMDIASATPIVSRMFGKKNDARAVADWYYGERGEFSRHRDIVNERLASGMRLEDALRDRPHEYVDGIGQATYKRNGKRDDGSRYRAGELRTDRNGRPVITEAPDSVSATRKDVDRRVTAINGLVNDLRRGGMTNGQLAEAYRKQYGAARETVGSDFIPGGVTGRPQDLGLPSGFTESAEAPVRVRTRAIKLLQDLRTAEEKRLLRRLGFSRRQSAEWNALQESSNR